VLLSDSDPGYAEEDMQNLQTVGLESEVLPEHEVNLIITSDHS
jgi:hypothetical protein